MEQVKREVRIRIEAPPLQSPLQTAAEPKSASETLPIRYRVLLFISFGFSLAGLCLAFVAS